MTCVTCVAVTGTLILQRPLFLSTLSPNAWKGIGPMTDVTDQLHVSYVANYTAAGNSWGPFSENRNEGC